MTDQDLQLDLVVVQRSRDRGLVPRAVLPRPSRMDSVCYARMLISIIQSGRWLPVIVVLLREKKKVCSF